MTKLSSLQLNAPTTLLDSISRPVPIGAQIGRGGEGSVYEVQNDPTLVAKIYHKRPLPEEQVAKLQAMVSCWSSPLETIAAWPRTILYDPSSRKPCGILMIRMDDALSAVKLSARMLLQVHDELIFETAEEEVEPTLPVIREVMESAAMPALALAVPLKVDARAADNWEAAH